MEDNNRKRRQNDPLHYPTSDPRFGQDYGHGRGFAGGPGDRYRAPPPITTSPAVSRGSIGGPTSAYGYYTESTPAYQPTLPTNQMNYQADYGPDQRQPQNFASYNANMMYNANPSASQNSAYDAPQQFQPRPPATMQILSDVAAPYFSGEPSNTPGAPIIQQQPSSSSSAGFQQSPADRPPLLQGYGGPMAAMSGMPQGSAEGIEDEEYGSSGLDEAYTSYQNALKEIFQNIRSGILVEASSSLVEVTDWLLSHVGELGEQPLTAYFNKEALTVLNQGLTADDETLHSDRIKLWNEFNTAWLAVLQKQKDLTLEYIHNGAQMRHPQSLITYDFLKKMAKELIRLCDNIEKHGLVDYQYGVWEERIITVLTECVDLLENNDEGVGGPGPTPRPNPTLGIGRPPP